MKALGLWDTQTSDFAVKASLFSPPPSFPSGSKIEQGTERVGLGPGRPAFCGCNFCFVTNWQCDLGHAPSLAKPQTPSRHRPPPSPSHEPLGVTAQGYSSVFWAPGTILNCSVLWVPRPLCLHASAQERSHLESNGPVEQVHPSCCYDYWINKMKRTQTQVHCPKGGNNTAKWPECLPTQGKGHSNAARRLTLSSGGRAVAPRARPWPAEWCPSGKGIQGYLLCYFFFFLNRNEWKSKKSCPQSPAWKCLYWQQRRSTVRRWPSEVFNRPVSRTRLEHANGKGLEGRSVPDPCLVEWSKCSAGKELFHLMVLCNRCIVHLPLPVLEPLPPSHHSPKWFLAPQNQKHLEHKTKCLLCVGLLVMS